MFLLEYNIQQIHTPESIMARVKLPKPIKKKEIPLYGGMVFLYTDQENYSRAVEAFTGNPIDTSKVNGLCSQLESPEGSVAYLVGWFNKDRSTLVHEIGHVGMFVLDRAGIDARDSCGEAYCYLIGWLAAELGIDE